MAAIRFDEGSDVFATNCFPVRSIFGQGYDGGGAWLVAHRAEQRKRFKAILCTKPRTYARIKEERKKCERMGTTLDEHKFSDDEEEHEDTPVLDGFFLMKHCCVEDPADVCSINISGKELSDVKEEDLTLFDNVAYVNAAENYLPFEAFHGFQGLRELEMPLNGLRSLKVDLTDYFNLELLDLSYNNLSSEDVMSLGLLRNLKVLHLTGNNFRSLPADMALPYIPDTQPKARHQRYPKLEVLMLDDNKLSDVSVFAALAGLQSLHHLNLEKNQISYVPQLKSVEGKVITQESKMSVKKSKPGSRASRSSRRSKSRASNSAQSERKLSPDPLNMEVTAKPLSGGRERTLADKGEITPSVNKHKTEDEKEEITESEVKVEKSYEQLDILVEEVIEETNGKTEEVGNCTERNEEKDLLTDDLSLNIGDLSARIRELNIDGQGEATQREKEETHMSHCPFPELRYLSLAHNMISEEEALLAVAAWPELIELIIHSNPLTTNHSGDPPLLKRFLTDRLGIKFVRKETPTIVKPNVEVHKRKHRQVSTVVPKVPRPTVEQRLALEAPPIPPPVRETTLTSRDSQKPLPPITPQSRPRTSPRVDAWTEDVRDQEDAFFMTQVDDQEEEVEKRVEKVVDKQVVKKARAPVEEKYRGFEVLLDVDSEEEDFDKPKDIQTNIRSLKHMLNHQLVYRDPTVHLDKVTQPVKEYRRVPVPPAKPKTQKEKVDEMLDNLRTQTTVDEASLNDVLGQQRKYKKQFPEAQSLLHQIQRRYNVVRVSSMKEAREARKHVQGAMDEMGRTNKQLENLRKKGVKVCD